jgi:uncharacterized protein YkwD
MRRVAASVCFIPLFAVIAAPGGARSGSAAQGRAPALTPRESALVSAINSARTLQRLSKLRVDAQLTRAARYHSRDMLRRQYFAHGDFGGRMATFHVRGRIFAENLVWGSGVLTAKAAVAAWLKSPPHRANLLNPRFLRLGVATPLGSFGGYATATMITADFAG